MKITSCLLLTLAAFVQQTLAIPAVRDMPDSYDDMDVCEKRPKYTYNTLDALVTDTVEFILRSSCNTSESDPFEPTFACFSRVLDMPKIKLEWTYRNNLPRVVGLKAFFCSYEAEASKCHDYRKTITDSFVCPEGYADKIRRVAGNFVYKMNQIFCDGAGTPMIMFAASDGDACLKQGRFHLLKCMYRTLPTLQDISESYFRQRAHHNSTLLKRPACTALDVIRRCTFQNYSKCSTPIPAYSVDHMLKEFSESINCPNEYERTAEADEFNFFPRSNNHTQQLGFQDV